MHNPVLSPDGTRLAISMMRAGSQHVWIKQLQGVVDEDEEMSLVAETPQSIVLTLTDDENGTTFVYSATAEDNLHQTAEADYTGTLDGAPGITYNGPAGAANHIRFACDELDILEGIIISGQTDAFVAALFRNSDLVAYFDTEDARASNGGFVEELNTEIVVEYHLDTIVTVVEGDVLRVGLLHEGEGTFDIDVNSSANAPFMIS